MQQTANCRSDYPPDFSSENIRICDLVARFTMTSLERINALIEAVRYVVTNRIEGAVVECGVWKGGSIMAAALTLTELGVTRELYLYDTFSGMCAPSEVDISWQGVPARERYSQTRSSEDSSDWCLCPLEEVKENVFSTGYPPKNLHFIEGKVEETIPEIVPDRIALLRLDTDWYQSTKHELNYLFPRLSPGGVIIVDDYGHWAGAKRAVDEYIKENDICILLHRIDYTGRIAVKMP